MKIENEITNVINLKPFNKNFSPLIELQQSALTKSGAKQPINFFLEEKAR